MLKPFKSDNIPHWMDWPASPERRRRRASASQNPFAAAYAACPCAAMIVLDELMRNSDDAPATLLLVACHVVPKALGILAFEKGKGPGLGGLVGTIAEYDHPLAGKLRQARPAARFSGTPPEIVRGAPSLGEHTAETLRTLGYDEAVIQALVADGVIGTADIKQAAE